MSAAIGSRRPPDGVVEKRRRLQPDADRGEPEISHQHAFASYADMLERAMRLLKPELQSLMLIENVGNLVCPALFDLGERAKVATFSVTEGEDKPLKYPHMFRAANVVILSKIDLLPHVRFDAARAIANALAVNPDLTVFQLSAYTGEGMAQWYGWLKHELASCVAAAA
ncbi:MAG: hydrogenase nickel incorporation protein HypB [Betaproteobacteria bacterium]